MLTLGARSDIIHITSTNSVKRRISTTLLITPSHKNCVYAYRRCPVGAKVLRVMRRKITVVLLVIVLLTGAGIMLYPSVSGWINYIKQTKVIDSYSQEVETIDDSSKQEAWQAAAEYNSRIFSFGQTFTLSGEDKKEYNSLLNYGSDGVMGYISIPKIDVSLAVYHGTDESVLKKGVGHVEGSSLPVGGESSHCVLSGHRGLPSAKLFTDLNELEVGDRFVLTVLDTELIYEVDQILTVLPSETDPLYIVEGEDFCTLITCTPYGINSHRLLVRGKRVVE